MRAARLCREALRSSVLSYVLGRSKSTITSVCLSRRLEACGVNSRVTFKYGQHGVGGVPLALRAEERLRLEVRTSRVVGALHTARLCFEALYSQVLF